MDASVQSPERWGENGREEGGWQLVIESVRGDEGERAVRWLPRLDSQVDCIWHKAQRWKKSGQLAHCTQLTPRSCSHLAMPLAPLPTLYPPPPPFLFFTLILLLFTLSWRLLRGVSTTFHQGIISHVRSSGPVFSLPLTPPASSPRRCTLRSAPCLSSHSPLSATLPCFVNNHLFVAGMAAAITSDLPVSSIMDRLLDVNICKSLLLDSPPGRD